MEYRAASSRAFLQQPSSFSPLPAQGLSNSLPQRKKETEEKECFHPNGLKLKALSRWFVLNHLRMRAARPSIPLGKDLTNYESGWKGKAAYPGSFWAKVDANATFLVELNLVRGCKSSTLGVFGKRTPAESFPISYRFEIEARLLRPAQMEEETEQLQLHWSRSIFLTNHLTHHNGTDLSNMPAFHSVVSTIIISVVINYGGQFSSKFTFFWFCLSFFAETRNIIIHLLTVSLLTAYKAFHLMNCTSLFNDPLYCTAFLIMGWMKKNILHYITHLLK